ncbi:MAG: DUF928 domain-containing protein [Geminicoccaceae bacterium]
MRGNKRVFIGGLVALSTFAAGGGQAEEQAAPDDGNQAQTERKIAETLGKIVFVPHDLGAPAVTDAGGVRAVSVLPKVELLAPERMARTLSSAPTLYWHISKAAIGPVRFTLLADDPTAIDPLLEIEVDGVDQEGIYGVSLDDHGLSLESGERYVWSVAVSSDGAGYGADLVAQTVLAHAAAPELAQTLDSVAPEDRAVRLASEGYWYDAIDTVSGEIGGASGQTWHTARASLLDQAGLLQAARFDRGQAEQ